MNPRKAPPVLAFDQQAAPLKSPPSRLAWLMWGLAATLYFIAFYHRVAPAVLTTELTADFGLTAAALGNLSAFYFYSYVAMQIPTGLLADRFGPRVLLTIGCVFAAFGTAVFAWAPNTLWANMGRLLIGGSSGMAFVCMLKLASHWMPARQFALTSGVALVVGVLGATLAGAPLRLGVDAFGWRSVMSCTALVTLTLAVITWLVVRDDPSLRGFKSYALGKAPTNTSTTAAPSAFAGLKIVLGYRNVLLLTFIPGAMTGITLTFAGLWGVPFLTTHYGLSQTNAAGLCSTMMIAWSCGCLAFGAATDKMGRRKPLYIGGVTIAMVLWSVVVLVPALPYMALVALLIATGFCAGSFIITFAFAKESVPQQFAGTASGVANMGVLLAPMLLQPLIGVILDSRWQAAHGVGGVVSATTAGGKHTFDFASYSTGFSMMLVWCALALVLLCFTRETYCRQAE